MKLFAEFKSAKNKNFDSITLVYSSLFWVSKNHSWFCRIWDKNWVNKLRRNYKEFGESYGRNKFEAYRLALKDLNS